jgi:hypothetical protein
MPLAAVAPGLSHARKLKIAFDNAVDKRVDGSSRFR